MYIQEGSNSASLSIFYMLIQLKVFGKIDILINNAGGPSAGTFADFDDEAWQYAFELTLLSYIRFIRKVVPDRGRRPVQNLGYRVGFL